MEALAVVLEAPKRLSVRPLDLVDRGADDVLVEVDWSGVSSGTERLLWNGRMPSFPGMGYPLVPGYESVGRVLEAGPGAGVQRGQRVFIPGSCGFKNARGLFGGAARRLVAPARRLAPLPDGLGEQGVLLALAATAHHALAGQAPPDLIVGHGVLGRLLARVAMACGAPAPTVWEIEPLRRTGQQGYQVCAPEADERRDYRAIYDASGQAALLDGLIARLGRGGEIVLAGFYEEPLAFHFAPAFQREARVRIAAEFTAADVAAVGALIVNGKLGLDGLITHRSKAASAGDAYRTAFEEAACLKMVLDWRDCA